MSDAEKVATARALIRGTRMLERVETGSSMPQYRLLSLLAAGDERSTALAQRLAVSKPAISNAVDTLTAAGHVRRLADPDDKRVVWLQITATGAEALTVADRHYADRLSDVLRRMEEPEVFLAAVASFAEALDEDLSERRRDHDLAHGREVGRDALPLRISAAGTSTVTTPTASAGAADRVPVRRSPSPSRSRA